MTICYIGNFRPSFSTETHLALTLEDLGHTVQRCQEDRVTAEEVAGLLVAYTPDLLLWTRTGTWLRGDSAAMLRTARDLGIPSVAYHLDLYAGLERAADVATEPWWTCDYVFTADGGSDAFWQAHAINHHWMPPGVYGPECYSVPVSHRPYDVVFVGQYHYHPEWTYRQELIDFLKATYGPRFRQFGHDGHAVRGHALNTLYAQSKVVVGDSLVLGFTHERYWSDRVPETLGRGGFLIMPWIKGLDDFFADGEHLAYYPFGDFDVLREKIDYYLTHGDERERIRRAGQEAVVAGHTYHHRMQAMLAVVGAGEARAA